MAAVWSKPETGLGIFVSSETLYYSRRVMHRILRLSSSNFSCISDRVLASSYRTVPETVNLACD